jgi:hypothetical protein
MPPKRNEILRGSSIAESTLMSYLQKRPIPIRRIGRFLRNRYAQFIDIQDVATKSPEEQMDCVLTRSLAAHASAAFAKLDPETAALLIRRKSMLPAAVAV